MSLLDDRLNPEIRRLIDELVHIRRKNAAGPVDNVELNPDRLKNLKNILRHDESLLRPFFEYLLDNYLISSNVIIRLYTVVLVDEIFRRSHIFRECVIENFEEFLKHTAETDALHCPLPSPKNLAKILKERTLKIIHNWYNTYGTAYRKLQVAYEYLKSCKTFDFQRIEAETIVERERTERERRRQEQTKERVVKKVAEDLQDIEDDMGRCLTEIDNGFRLLIPDLSTDDDNCCVRTGSTLPSPQATTTTPATVLHAHGIPNRKIDLSIKISLDSTPVKIDQDNVDLINNVKDCNKLLVGRYLPKIRQLLNVLSRYGCDASLTKTLIDWRVRLEEVKRKFDDLKLESKIPQILGAATAGDDEDGDFEIVPEKEGLEEIFRPPSPDLPDYIREFCNRDDGRSKKYSDDGPSTSGVGSNASSNRDSDDGPSTSGVGTNASSNRDVGRLKKYSDDGPSTSGIGTNASSNRDTPSHVGENRSSIPVVSYGIDLAYWEQDTIPKPMIVRNNADCHRFWRPADGEEAVECSDIEVAAYRTRVMEFVGEYQPVERECRTPLRGTAGKLCTRRDRYKCPFHGAIIPRDEHGKPLEKEKEAASQPSTSRAYTTSAIFGDSEFMKDVELVTGKNLTSAKKKGQRVVEEQETESAAETSRDRLAKKVFNRSSVKRVAAVQTALDSAKQKKRFGGHWQYVFRDQ